MEAQPSPADPTPLPSPLDALPPNPTPTTPPAPPKPSRPLKLRKNGLPDRRQIASPRNGQHAGCKAGSEKKTKLTYVSPAENEALIQQAAAALMEGKSLRTASRIGPPTDQDRKALVRLTGMSPEEFNDRLTARLRDMADLTAECVFENLHSRSYKPGELSFLLSVVIDKLDKREGRSSLQASTVNIQVNNFSGDTRSPQQVIDSLAGPSAPKSGPPIDVA